MKGGGGGWKRMRTGHIHFARWVELSWGLVAPEFQFSVAADSSFTSSCRLTPLSLFLPPSFLAELFTSSFHSYFPLTPNTPFLTLTTSFRPATSPFTPPPFPLSSPTKQPTNQQLNSTREEWCRTLYQSGHNPPQCSQQSLRSTSATRHFGSSTTNASRRP